MNFVSNFKFDQLSKEAQAAIKGALASRGSRKGLLKKTAPATHLPAYAAWQAIMAELNTQRISVYGLMMMPESFRPLFEEIGAYCGEFHVCINETLQDPYEFNLYHYHKVEAEEAGADVPCKVDPKQLTLF